MQNTVDESIMEGPIDVGMVVCRMLPGKNPLNPTIFRYEISHISSKTVLDFQGTTTRLVWVKDAHGSNWWFFETEFRRRFVVESNLKASA